MLADGSRLRNLSGNNTLSNSIRIAQPGGGRSFSNVTVENQQSRPSTTNSLTLTNGFTRVTGNTSPVALTFTGPGNTTVGNTASGAIRTGANSSLTKDGTGRLTLNGTSTYTGVTNIKQGTLAIGQTDAINTGSRLIVGQLQSGMTSAVQGTFAMGAYNQTFRGVQLNAGFITANPVAPTESAPAGQGVLTVGGRDTPRPTSGGTDGIGEFDLRSGTIQAILNGMNINVVKRSNRQARRPEQGRHGEAHLHRPAPLFRRDPHRGRPSGHPRQQPEQHPRDFKQQHLRP